MRPRIASTLFSTSSGAEIAAGTIAKPTARRTNTSTAPALRSELPLLTCPVVMTRLPWVVAWRTPVRESLRISTAYLSLSLSLSASDSSRQIIWAGPRLVLCCSAAGETVPSRDPRLQSFPAYDRFPQGRNGFVPRAACPSLWSADATTTFAPARHLHRDSQLCPTYKVFPACRVSTDRNGPAKDVLRGTFQAASALRQGGTPLRRCPVAVPFRAETALRLCPIVAPARRDIRNQDADQLFADASVTLR